MTPEEKQRRLDLFRSYDDFNRHNGLRLTDVDDGTALDLNGRVFTVRTAHAGGETIPPGLYTAAQLQALGFDEVIDTADGAGGTLRVLGAGTVLIVK